VGSGVDLDGLEFAGYTAGLSAGLAKALDDVDDTDLTTARGGYAAVPAHRVHEDATVVEHRFAGAEGVAILDVRLPAGLVSLRHAGDRPEVVGLRLAAVRIGLARRLLDYALAAPFPLVRRQLVLAAITGILSALESVRGLVAGMAATPSRAAVLDVHARLTRLDWQLARLFGPAGFGADHPARVLFVAELVATTWVGPG
jgi:hypothetical protein